jgi:hypothetical protein
MWMFNSCSVGCDPRFHISTLHVAAYPLRVRVSVWLVSRDRNRAFGWRQQNLYRLFDVVCG